MNSILISGGTGSFGTAFAKHLMALPTPPHRIVIYSRGEHAQETMARALPQENFRWFIGDVRDRDRLEFAMRGIDTVVHAAALKIVPTAEYNPTECIATNVGGAENVVKAAIRTEVRKVIALSTDKSVNPVNLYGASKLASEKIFIAANALAGGRCAFSVMRYGNVVGSRGSVIPVFKRLIDEGSPLTITDARMTRFWITLPHSVAFTLACLGVMHGREIFVPKIPSMRIVDLAAAMSARSPIEFTGIRPGEKLHEVLITEDESRHAWEAEDYYVIRPTVAPTQWNKELKVKEGFRYASDTNERWLTPDEILAVL